MTIPAVSYWIVTLVAAASGVIFGLSLAGIGLDLAAGAYCLLASIALALVAFIASRKRGSATNG